MAAHQDPYRELFERSADAILIIEGDQFVECNDATVRMLRYMNREELLRTHPSELSPPTQPDGRDSYEKANEMIAIAFERGSHRFEWAHQRADGEVFPVEVLLTAVEEADRRVLHVVWRDITDRKQLEEQLRHAQKMEAVGKLAGGIAHDFNNLLVVILGHAELLDRLVENRATLREHTHAIQEASRRAAELVKQLLAFGRRQQRLPEVLDLNRVVERMRVLLERLIGEDLLLETRLAPEPLPIEVDPGQIEQVVMNLVSNARDASPGGGRLRLVTATVSLPGDPNDAGAGARSGSFAELRVIDSGIGMTPETMEHAFDPFFTTKEPGRGTGLGLSTVYSIVQQSHGRIAIDSQPGRGTEVRVLLPLSDKPITPRPIDAPPAAASPAAGGERILIAEDDRAVRAMMVDALAERGYDVVAVADGLAGVEAYCRDPGRFALVVTDVIMPRAGGPKMVELLAERGHRPRVLFLSGYTDDALSELHLVGGGVDLLEKPFTPDQLATRVRRALERRRREGQ